MASTLKYVDSEIAQWVVLIFPININLQVLRFCPTTATYREYNGLLAFYIPFLENSFTRFSTHVSGSFISAPFL